MGAEVIHMNSTILIQKGLAESEPSMTKENEVKVQRVLVVDDEKSISELITTSLRFVGFEVRTAASGAEALRVAEEFKPHALISCGQIPDLK
jgi:two-component system OmpR family response regulator